MSCDINNNKKKLTLSTHCDETKGRRNYLGNNITSQWVGDVPLDIKQSHDY